ncbi:MAG: tRNA guanosine(34) transglycosylase Tgt [Chloroflexi bacterium]|nr:tRNA guanosine(34) transglycosylase Tgt [Chloroflexota bacterium]
MGCIFEVTASALDAGARAGNLLTMHGSVPTPAFMPVGTQGTVKSLTPEDLECAGTCVVLANTYHLYLRPGIDIIEHMGGLHRFMAWNGPILTDSGGFQVFSLAGLRRVSDEGVLFSSHIDGGDHFFTPESAIAYQERLGSDIAMVLDVCHAHDLDAAGAKKAMDLTHRWAARCLQAHQRSEQALFGIVQGGTNIEFRLESAHFLASQGFQGYAIGGLSVGEPKETTWNVLEATLPALPCDSPRYLMGVGAPDDIVRSVALGVDLFDSVLPTRVARHGAVYTTGGRLNLRNAQYERCEEPIDRECDCYTCRTFTTAYMHHLFRCEELLAYRLATIHNVRFMVRLMSGIRQAILGGRFADYQAEFLGRYKPPDEQARLEQKRKWSAARHAPGG